MSKIVEKKLAELTVNDLWIDAIVSEDDGKVIGLIGTDEAYTDEDGGDAEYCGWFFTWPGSAAGLATEDERKAVIASLEIDGAEKHNEEIPYELAVEKLRTYLVKAR